MSNSTSRAAESGRAAFNDSSHASGFFDLLLEAVSYLADSAWSGFEDAFVSVDAVEASPVPSAREAARTLSALGHLDLHFDKRNVRPLAWSVSSPVLLRAGEQGWLLCGRRPTHLVAELTTEAALRDAPVQVERLPTQPSRITLTASVDVASDIVTAVRSGGHDLRINTRGAEELARALPTVGDVLDGLQRTTPVTGGAIEKLDHDGGGKLTWRRVYDWSSVGAYRFDPPPLAYVFVDEPDGRPARVDARLARLLTLVGKGVPPFAWDPSTLIATCWYYAEPPGLFERALALSSGYGPEPMPYERATRYRGVREEIAVDLYSRLSALDLGTKP
jgi:hypothetical protein